MLIICAYQIQIKTHFIRTIGVLSTTKENQTQFHMIHLILCRVGMRLLRLERNHLQQGKNYAECAQQIL